MALEPCRGTRNSFPFILLLGELGVLGGCIFLCATDVRTTRRVRHVVAPGFSFSSKKIAGAALSVHRWRSAGGSKER
ncbi:MAG TPA: hypothetical protein PLD59_14855, partial [Tepidisphaeraceae bacterium]|nr:hypothetical protein [Tepidisphaeraceae bacterium]